MRNPLTVRLHVPSWDGCVVAACLVYAASASGWMVWYNAAWWSKCPSAPRPSDYGLLALGLLCALAALAVWWDSAIGDGLALALGAIMVPGAGQGARALMKDVRSGLDATAPGCTVAWCAVTLLVLALSTRRLLRRARRSPGACPTER